MSKDFNLPPVDVMEEKTVEVKIYHIYPLILKKFKEFGEGHANDIDRYAHMLKKKYPSVKLEDHIAMQIARFTFGSAKIYIWTKYDRISRSRLIAIFKKALRDSGISQML
jgi:hypothetical protein